MALTGARSLKRSGSPRPSARNRPPQGWGCQKLTSSTSSRAARKSNQSRSVMATKAFMKSGGASEYETRSFLPQHFERGHALDSEADADAGDLHLVNRGCGDFMRDDHVPVCQRSGDEVVIGHLQEGVDRSGRVVLGGDPGADLRQAPQHRGVGCEKERCSLARGPFRELIDAGAQLVPHPLDAEHGPGGVLLLQP